MHVLRHLTLAWPGLPWLWLRGSMSGLVLALAFAVSLDVAILATFVWSSLIELQVTLAIWTAVAAVWLIATVSAVASFPPPIASPRADAADAVFRRARDAYLARDWLGAEARLGELLGLSPTDGEAQLMLATLLRRTGRIAEAKKALEQLARSDSGSPWRREIAGELRRLADAADGVGASPRTADPGPRRESDVPGRRSAA